MKRIIFSSVLIIAAAVFTGCLKDNGFEDQNYGIQVQNTRAVSFPASKNSPIGFALNAVNTLQTLKGPVIALEAPGPDASPIKVTVETNDELITDDPVLSTYLTVADPADYSFGANSNGNVFTINPGKTFDSMEIVIPDATVFDPNLTYGIGLTILSADNGYNVVSNARNIVVQFSVKNIYDGVYSITGTALRAGDPVLSGPFGPYERNFITSGANSVQWEAGSGVPWANGSGSQLPGGYEPNITIDPVTLQVTSLTATGNATLTNATGTGYPQLYDPANRVLTFEFTYNAGPTSRLFTFRAEYLRPR